MFLSVMLPDLEKKLDVLKSLAERQTSSTHPVWSREIRKELQELKLLVQEMRVKTLEVIKHPQKV